MNREKIGQIIKSAREDGEVPDLRGLDLSEIDLSSMDLKNIILGGRIGNLICADLRGANLSEADLSEADFKENPLFLPSDAPNPGKAKYNDETIFPEGFNRYSELEKVD
jgi:hypothetical protein